jgi:hypothetical protein
MPGDGGKKKKKKKKPVEVAPAPAPELGKSCSGWRLTIVHAHKNR